MELKDKGAKKKRLSVTSINVTTRKQLLQRPAKFTPLSKTKTTLKDNQPSKVSKIFETNQQTQKKADKVTEEETKDIKSDEGL